MSRDRARNLRNNPTDAEHTLWKHLRLRQVEGHKFRRQQPLGPGSVSVWPLQQREHFVN